MGHVMPSPPSTAPSTAPPTAANTASNADPLSDPLESEGEEDGGGRSRGALRKAIEVGWRRKAEDDLQEAAASAGVGDIHEAVRQKSGVRALNTLVGKKEFRKDRFVRDHAGDVAELLPLTKR
jgi:hypothetical protein